MVSGESVANNAEHDGVVIDAGGVVVNNAVLSGLTNHGSVHGVTISGNSLMASSPPDTGILGPIPDGYFLVGGMVLSENRAVSATPVDALVQYENREIPEGHSADDLKVLVYEWEQEQWKETASKNTGNGSLKISTPLISAYAAVVAVDGATGPGDDTSGGGSGSTCFLDTLKPGRWFSERWRKRAPVGSAKILPVPFLVRPAAFFDLAV